MNFWQDFLLILTIITPFLTLYSLLLLSYLIWTFSVSRLFYAKFRDNEKVKEIIKESLDFYAKELGLKNVTINLKSTFPPKSTGVHGFVGKNYWNEPKEYNMTIYLNHSLTTILSTAAHEMIHVKQWECGDLQNVGYLKLWKGEDHTKTSYSKLPWEIEAFEQEKVLSDKFLKHKKIIKSLTRKFFELILPI